MNLTPQQVARKIAAAASDKKARDILLLNMENLSPLTDYFIIASADNVTLVKAVADNIEEKLAEEGILPSHTEGYAEALDFNGLRRLRGAYLFRRRPRFL